MASTTTVVTAEQIIAEVRRLAAERPDFVYTNPAWFGTTRSTCQYTHGDEPGCIFGHALINLGVDMVGRAGPIMDVLIDLGVEATMDQRFWMSDVQSNQDYGIPWGEAVSDVDKVCGPNV